MSRPQGTRQYEVLAAIRAFRDAKGISPTIRDLMAMMQFKSSNTISYYLRLLEDEGLIHRGTYLSRSIVVTGHAPSSGPRVKLWTGTIPEQISVSIVHGKRTISDELRAKRVAAGKKGRGIDAMKSVRGDPELQARIDMVVTRAKASEAGPHVDVMYGSQYRIRHGSLKAFKVG